jgi:carbon starvation protein
VLYFLLAKEQAWKVLWPIFGTANQLLAALTLLTISVWLKKTSKKQYIFLITFVPMLVMFCMSVWSLWIFVSRYFGSFATQGLHFDFIGATGTILLALALYLAVESLYFIFLSKKKAAP